MNKSKIITITDDIDIRNIIIGGLQEHQSIKYDGICTCLTSSMGQGGGYVPIVIEVVGNE